MIAHDDAAFWHGRVDGQQGRPRSWPGGTAQLRYYNEGYDTAQLELGSIMLPSERGILHMNARQWVKYIEWQDKLDVARGKIPHLVGKNSLP